MSAEEIAAIVDVLWFMPPPARVPVAEGLHGLGVRVHPELATSVMVTDNSTPGMGNHAAKAPIAMQAMAFLEETNPELASRIRVVQGNPAAREKLVAELRDKIGTDVAVLQDEGSRLESEQ